MNRKHDQDPLSVEVLRRRNQMRGELQQTMVRIHGQRRRRWWAGLSLIGLATLLALGPGLEPPPETTNVTPPTVPESRQWQHVSFEIIDDDELLRILAELGEPAVLGTVGGEVKVIPQGKLSP